MNGIGDDDLGQQIGLREYLVTNLHNGLFADGRGDLQRCMVTGISNDLNATVYCDSCERFFQFGFAAATCSKA